MKQNLMKIKILIRIAQIKHKFMMFPYNPTNKILFNMMRIFQIKIN